MKKILIPGLMLTPIKGTNGGYKDQCKFRNKKDFDKLNYTLFEFWLKKPILTDKSYEAYVELCNEVCYKITSKNAKAGYETKIIGTSTGCTVILDKQFNISKLKNVKSVELLSPAIYIYLCGLFGVTIVIGKGKVGPFVLFILNVISRMIGGWIIVPKLFLGIPLSLFNTRSHYPLIDITDLTMAISLKEVMTYMNRYSTIGISLNRKIFKEYDVTVKLATSDLIVNTSMVERLLVKRYNMKRSNITYVIGDHETPLTDILVMKSIEKAYRK